jgi:nitrogen fixation-related uncharacterized protein
MIYALIPICIAVLLAGLSVMLLAIDSTRNDDAIVWPCDTGDCYADAHGGCDRPCPINQEEEIE